jgi:hypothetical protein
MPLACPRKTVSISLFSPKSVNEPATTGTGAIETQATTAKDKNERLNERIGNPS